MNELFKLIKIVLRIDKFLIFKIFKDKIFKIYSTSKKRKQVQKISTYNFNKISIKTIPFKYFEFPENSILIKYQNELQILAEKILNHKFDIFCSGEVILEHGLVTNGFNGFNYSNEIKFENWENFINSKINSSNKYEALRVASKISRDYKPIDWQLDIKSGFRWDETIWYQDLKYGNIPGADIKIPWEIGRFQHIIYLPIITSVYKHDNKNYSIFIDEFKNQIYDFIASNPPEFGCQWKSPMDVGIRAVNWLICYDLFVANGINFEEDFVEIFSKSIYQHAKFIYDNLEWSSGLRNNHYFCNIVSLLIISSYLPINQQVNEWLNFAISEFLQETDAQYYNDGGNFENSLSYHFLTTEMLLWGLLCIDALPKEKLNSIRIFIESKYKISKKHNKNLLFNLLITDEDTFISIDNFIEKKLIEIFKFTDTVSRNDGTYSQIGDNDSGRFLIISPFVNKSEANKNYIPILNLIEVLTNLRLTEEKSFEYYFTNSMLLNNGIKNNLSKKILNEKNFNSSFNKVISFSYSGLYIFKNEKYQMEIKCSNLGQWGKGGHDHNDQLSVTLSVNDKPIIVDPGTYLYTPFIKLRNDFRSVNLHNTLAVKSFEQNPYDKKSIEGLFWFEKNKAKPKILELKDNLIIAEHYAYKKPHKRIINFSDKSISGIDICEINFEKIINFHLSPEVSIQKIIDNGIILNIDELQVKFNYKNAKLVIEEYNYSHAYGCLLKSKRISLKTKQFVVEWGFRIENK